MDSFSWDNFDIYICLFLPCNSSVAHGNDVAQGTGALHIFYIGLKINRKYLIDHCRKPDSSCNRVL